MEHFFKSSSQNNDIVDFIKLLLGERWTEERICYVKEIPPRETVYTEFPAVVNPLIVNALNSIGIEKPYLHQGRAFELAIGDKDIVVVTPTASGKTLCYNVPALNKFIEDPRSTFLYIFPTKALSQDQLKTLSQLAEKLNLKVSGQTFDSDTPPASRQQARAQSQFIMTNPDMLHTGILPNHMKWARFLSNLKYVVIDEIHTYRGVFGSHVTNVIRRLKRVCQYYDSNPVFICLSATIKNPKELAEKIIERPVVLIDENGAPSGKKLFILWNPPLRAPELGEFIRVDSLLEAERVIRSAMENDVSTIAFMRSRNNVELLTKYLREDLPPERSSKLRSYRGGYLKNERRQIENDLFTGKANSVISTNALELGIDIGNLDLSIIVGYPGSMASIWQEAGRVGRRNDLSLAIFIATDSPIDQFLVNNNDYFFGRPVESGYVNPNNIYILQSHVKCAAFELPFMDGEAFGDQDIFPLLELLDSSSVLRHSNTRWHWCAEGYPADNVKLRSATIENYTIVNDESKEIVGEVDEDSAFWLIYPGAIYFHQTEQFIVKNLDLDNHIAHVEPSRVDYFTRPRGEYAIKVLSKENEKENDLYSAGFGDVRVNSRCAAYMKIKFDTHELVGFGEVSLPEMELQTQGTWFSFPGLRMDKPEYLAFLSGFANVLSNILPFYLMSDSMDVRTFVENQLYVYDQVPGGIGFSNKIFHNFGDVVKMAADAVTNCKCEHGCPACVGPAARAGLKKLCLDALMRLADKI
jgi:DEAD/DEAH box helicase domain-containing protein